MVGFWASVFKKKEKEKLGEINGFTPGRRPAVEHSSFMVFRGKKETFGGCGACEADGGKVVKEPYVFYIKSGGQFVSMCGLHYLDALRTMVRLYLRQFMGREELSIPGLLMVEDLEKEDKE